MSLLSVWMLELSLYTHGPLLRTMKFQLFFFWPVGGARRYTTPPPVAPSVM